MNGKEREGTKFKVQNKFTPGILVSSKRSVLAFLTASRKASNLRLQTMHMASSDQLLWVCVKLAYTGITECRVYAANVHAERPYRAHYSTGSQSCGRVACVRFRRFHRLRGLRAAIEFSENCVVRNCVTGTTPFALAGYQVRNSVA